MCIGAAGDRQVQGREHTGEPGGGGGRPFQGQRDQCPLCQGASGRRRLQKEAQQERAVQGQGPAPGQAHAGRQATGGMLASSIVAMHETGQQTLYLWQTSPLYFLASVHVGKPGDLMLYMLTMLELQRSHVEERAAAAVLLKMPGVL